MKFTLPLPEDPYPKSGSFVSGCGFMLLVLTFGTGWTAGTVFFDLMIYTGLAAGDKGEALFLLIFSIPFNLIMLSLWAAVILGLIRRVFGYTIGSGITVVDIEQKLGFRLPRVPPVWAAFLAAFLGPFPAIFLLGPAFGGNPPVVAALVALAAIAIAVVMAYVIVDQKCQSGIYDLVIDRSRQVLILPQTFGRHRAVTVPCADLVSIRVVKEERKDGEGGTTIVFALLAQWKNDGKEREERLTELRVEEHANILAKAIRHEIQ